ncbi:uncharacterized protein K02A2.6-like [Zophobas morio]
MNVEIENFVSKCQICQQYSRNNTKEPLILHQIEKIPWFKVGIDIYELYGEVYLLVVDYYSKYAEIANLNRNMTSTSVIKHLKSIFARHGIPAIVVSDSGTQLISQELQKFAEEWKFQIHPSSPYHQQGNGMAERTIQTVKKLLKKTIETKADIELALLAYRNTPVYGTYTPSQILMARLLRDNVPRSKHHLESQLIERNKFHKEMEQARQKQKKYYDRSTKERPILENLIYYQDKPGTRWKKGKIVKSLNDRSYLIQTEEGKTLRRNKQFLKRRREEIDIETNIENDIGTNEEQDRVQQHATLVVPIPPNNRISLQNRPHRTIKKNPKYFGPQFVNS